MPTRSGSRSDSRSPTRSASSASLLASDPSDEYKWNSFEIRTLICLIIKGAHRDRYGPVDPMDFADKLNKALNPVKASNQRSKAMFDRDIPVDDVQKMLRRILAKKSHAVDVVQRDPAAAITKRQVNAFMRQLDFDGGESEWLDEYRREKVMAERTELRRQLKKRKEGRPMSQERWKDGQDRLRDIQSPRAHKLLTSWSMGKTFFDGEMFQHRGRWAHADRSAGAAGPEPIRGRSPARRGRSVSPGEITNISGTTYNGSGEGKDCDDPFGPHNSRGYNGISAWDNSMTVQTPAWETTGNSLNPLAATPNPPVGGWAGGFAQPAPTPQLDRGHDTGHGYAATPSMYGSFSVRDHNHGNGGDLDAASPP